MSNDLKNRELMKDFIRAYENHPCLWRVKSPDYHDRSKREKAYNNLLKIYRLIDANADRDAVVKKVNSLRTNYRRERKKVETSRLSAVAADDVYEPNLWYYHMFEFLNDTREEYDEQPTEVSEYLNVFVEEDDPLSSTTQSTSTSPEEKPLKITHKKTPYSRPSERNNMKTERGSEEFEHIFKPENLKEDRYDILGKNVALKMKDISNKTQRLIAEKLINDVLYLAEMDQLSPSHSIQSQSSVTEGKGSSFIYSFGD